MFLGTLWIFIKQIKAPYVFDSEYGIAMHGMQGNQARRMVFQQLQREPGVYSRIMVGKILQSSCLLSDVRTPV